MGRLNNVPESYDKEELELLLSNMPAGVIIENRDCEITYMNEFSIRSFGDCVGKKSSEIFIGRGSPDIPCPVDVILKDDEEFFKQTAAGKNDRLFEITASPLHNPDGSRSVIEIVSDVTDEQKLDQMKSDFINIVAHEMRTPLAAVMGFRDMLAMRSDGMTDKQKYYIESIGNNARKLKQLIDDILDLSYLDAGILKPGHESVDLNSVVSEALASHQALIAEKNHDISLDVSEAMTAECNPQNITRVMDNIIFNAIYYTDVNGQVEVTIEDRDSDMLVSVKDTGIGISEQDLPNIFDRFFMADASLTRHCDRIGIGLTLAKGYVELHGGRIWAESTPGEGSTFYFTLPKYNTGDTDDEWGETESDT